MGRIYKYILWIYMDLIFVNHVYGKIVKYSNPYNKGIG